ncbi:MAG: GPR endopeptidase, partial [Clostridia bacterium]
IYLKTGIETFDMISGVCKSIDPAIVVLIDSYGTKKLERVGCSLQLSSSGLVPGGAILGDKKLKAISKKTLKIPCITIGCPLMCFAEDGFVTILQNVDTVVELLSQIAAEAINNAFSV